MDDILRPKPATPQQPVASTRPQPFATPAGTPGHHPEPTTINVVGSETQHSDQPNVVIEAPNTTTYEVEEQQDSVSSPAGAPALDVKSLDDLDAPGVSDTQGGLSNPSTNLATTAVSQPEVSPVVENSEATVLEDSSKEPGVVALPQPSQVPTQQLSQEPTSQSHNESPMEPVTPLSPKPELPTLSEEPKPEAKVSQAPGNGAPRRKGAGMAIAVGLILAAGLIGGAGYAYLQNKKETKNATPAVTKVETPAKNPAKSSDVEKTITDIDADLKKIDDTKDYQETDLSDATLGL